MSRLPETGTITFGPTASPSSSKLPLKKRQVRLSCRLKGADQSAISMEMGDPPLIHTVFFVVNTTKTEDSPLGNAIGPSHSVVHLDPQQDFD